MIHSSLVLFWMLKLAPTSPGLPAFEETAESITEASNKDGDPLDAAATLTAVGFYESHFVPNAWSKHSDPVRSFGIFQLSLQWIILPAPLSYQAEVALKLVRDSYARCGSLAMYASGSCKLGREAADDRAKLAWNLKNPAILEQCLPAIKKHHGDN